MLQETVPTSLLDPATRHRPEWTLHWLFRLALCGEFVGHGAFGVLLPSVSAAIGRFEILLGVLCMEATWPAFFVFVCTWKLGTEFLHVPAQAYGAWGGGWNAAVAMSPPCCGSAFTECLRPTGPPPRG